MKQSPDDRGYRITGFLISSRGIFPRVKSIIFGVNNL